MSRPRWIYSLMILVLTASGCRSVDMKFAEPPSNNYRPEVLEIEYPDVAEACHDRDALLSAPPPVSIRRPEETEKWPLTLEEVIRMALSQSKVVRNLGGQIVANPVVARTVYDPAIQETDPRFGVEAALSAFDAQFAAQIFQERQENTFNNLFFGGGANQRVATSTDFQMGISKTTASGTTFSLDHTIFGNRSNVPVPPNRFTGAYDAVVRGSFRHPLLQGGGIQFNRIAGPNATAGNYNGVLLARVNTDVNLADFQMGVRDLLQNVERTYWELYFAYRDLDTKMAGRKLALESWKLEQSRVQAGATAPKEEAFARDQYYLAQIAVENALTGNATGTGGVYAVERQLRALLGLPTSDRRLIVPSSEPVLVDVQFDWSESLALALGRRTELRRQQWTIKGRELEVVAARNFRMMRLDVLGEYRWRGFGDDLFGDTNVSNGSAYEDLFTGDLADWRFGLELRTPVGNRIGHTAIRSAELRLRRERAVLEEMERQISAQLNAAFTELDRAYVVTRSAYNRRTATLIRLQGERDLNDKGRTRLDLVLDAQRAAVEAESQFFRALVDYNQALLEVHYNRGTLFDVHQVALAEGPWSGESHQRAAKLARRFRKSPLNYCLACPGTISRGATPQHVDTNEPRPAPAGPGPNASAPEEVIAAPQ